MICGIPIENHLLVVPDIFLTIVDNASQATWVYLMREKAETSQLLKNFIAMVKTQFRKKMLRL